MRADRSSMHALSAFAATLAVALVARAERPRIAVEYVHTDATTRRVLAEVRNAGLDPVDVRASDLSAGPSELADRYRAVAILSIKKANRIELAVLSPETREVIYAATVTSKGGTPASVRAAEELHGRLIELPEGTPPPPVLEETPSEPEPVPAAPAPAKPARPQPPATDDDSAAITFGDKERLTQLAKDAASTTRVHKPDKERTALWLGASGGAESGTTRLNQMSVVHVEARLEPAKYFSVAAFAILPVTPEKIVRTEGSGALDTSLFGALLRGTALDAGGILRVSAGAGGGVAVVSMSGLASSPAYEGRHTSAVTGIGMATVGMNARLAPWIALRADATAGLAAYRPVMRFDGHEVATWGPTVVAFTGGIEVNALGFGGDR